MILGTCKVEIHIPYAESLKDKRQVVKSIIALSRNKFNISMAEVEDQDLWQKGVLGVACVSNEAAQANSQIDKVINFLEADGRFEVVRVEVGIF
ncbi:MAG: DUF503 domain-containing protein [Thermincolia bacterium]